MTRQAASKTLAELEKLGYVEEARKLLADVLESLGGSEAVWTRRVRLPR